MDIQDKLKPIERRLPVLKKHMEQADIYLKYKGKKALNESEQILFTAAGTAGTAAAQRSGYGALKDKRRVVYAHPAALF